MEKILINKTECMLFDFKEFDDKKTPKKFKNYPYKYAIRHAETDWTRPVSVEKFVCCNRLGIILAKKEFDLGADGWKDVRSYKYLDIQ